MIQSVVADNSTCFSEQFFLFQELDRENDVAWLVDWISILLHLLIRADIVLKWNS